MNNEIKSILNTIESNGFEAYVIGGFVRDHLLGITSTDIDIATNALPKDLKLIFKNYNAKVSLYGAFKIMTDKTRQSSHNSQMPCFRNDRNMTMIALFSQRLI